MTLNTEIYNMQETWPFISETQPNSLEGGLDSTV